MNIYYDIERIGVASQLSIETQEKLNKIKDLVIQRLKILEDDINKQNGEIILNMMTKPPGILYKGFSRELTDKLLTCVTNDDFKYLFNQLGI